jgi:hypothetical protein
MCFDVPTTASVQRVRLEAVFDSPRTLEGWTRQLLKTATHVAALLLEIERGQGRGAGLRRRPDGAAPLIGSSQAIRAVHQRIERVAATDFPVLIEGASGPQPHLSFIDVFGETAFCGGQGEVERAGDIPREVTFRFGIAEARSVRLPSLMAVPASVSCDLAANRNDRRPWPWSMRSFHCEANEADRSAGRSVCSAIRSYDSPASRHSLRARHISCC